MIAILDDLKQRPGCCGMTDQANNSNRWSPINCYGKKAQSRIKILKQVEYESARRKKHVSEKQEKEGNKSQHSLFFTFISLKLKGTKRNSRELI